jgi:hypothetical protein
MRASKGIYSKNIAPKNYQTAGDTIGKYVGEEKLFAPKYRDKKTAAVGPNPGPMGSQYSGMTSVY